MRLVSFRDPAGPRAGLVTAGDRLVDLAALVPGLPSDMSALVALPAERWSELAARAADAPGAALRPLASVELLAPVPAPRRNIICVGKNYRAHAREFQASGFDASAAEVEPEAPVVFTKATTSVIGPGAAVPASADPTSSVDYEGELAVVIGRGGRNIPRARAMQHVFGYTIVNDVTSRATQKRHRQWFLGKSFDGFCPMGPALVTADEIPDPARLELRTEVNGELRQRASVADLIFDIPTLIETISGCLTLLPGDIIATGTPEGVGIGFDPPRFLRAGDRVRVIIEPIGALENPVV